MVCKTAATGLVGTACHGVGLEAPRTSKRIETDSDVPKLMPMLAVWKHREPRSGLKLLHPGVPPR